MKVKLKKATPEDYTNYYEIRCSPGDIYWNGYETVPDKEDFRELFLQRLGDAPFEKPEDRRLFLIQIDGDVNVGFVQLIKRNDGIDISYSIVENYQRHGYAVEALKLAVDLAREFDDKIYVQIRDDNKASQHVALKCAFKKTEFFEERDYPKAGKVKLRKYRCERQK